MNSLLDSDVGIAVELIEALDREIANILLLTRHGSPEKAAFLAQKLAAKLAEREQLRTRAVAAAQLVQQRTDHRAGLPERDDRE